MCDRFEIVTPHLVLREVEDRLATARPLPSCVTGLPARLVRTLRRWAGMHPAGIGRNAALTE